MLNGTTLSEIVNPLTVISFDKFSSCPFGVQNCILSEDPPHAGMQQGNTAVVADMIRITGR